MSVNKVPVISRYHLELARRELIVIYRDLIAELESAATSLEKAERKHDPHPAVKPAMFANAIQKAGVMHYILDLLLK